MQDLATQVGEMDRTGCQMVLQRIGHLEEHLAQFSVQNTSLESFAARVEAKVHAMAAQLGEIERTDRQEVLQRIGVNEEHIAQLALQSVSFESGAARADAEVRDLATQLANIERTCRPTVVKRIGMSADAARSTAKVQATICEASATVGAELLGAGLAAGQIVAAESSDEGSESAEDARFASSNSGHSGIAEEATNSATSSDTYGKEDMSSELPPARVTQSASEVWGRVRYNACITDTLCLGPGHMVRVLSTRSDGKVAGVCFEGIHGVLNCKAFDVCGPQLDGAPM